MKINKLFLCVAVACLSFASAFAQTTETAKAGVVSKTDERVEFAPYWFIQFEDGITHTSGYYPQKSIDKVLSPEFTLGGGYQFNPVFALRANIGYGESRTYVPEVYRGSSSQFYQLQGDALINICNLLGGYNHHRGISIFPFVGVAGNLGVENLAVDEPALPDAWKAVKFFPSARAGVHFDFRITNHVSAILEGNYNIYSDKLNSKLEGGLDRQQNVLAGLKYKMGDGYQPSRGYLAALAAAKEAAIAAERAAAEKAAAEAEAARLAAERLAAEKAAAEAERLAAEKAAAEAAAIAAAALHQQKCLEYTCDIFFALDRSVIRPKEMEKVDNLAQFLKENTDFKVALCGYADRQTGTPGYNMPLSERRVKSVKKALIERGIAEDRILTDFKGDTVQPFAVQEQNRLVTCRVQ